MTGIEKPLKFEPKELKSFMLSVFVLSLIFFFFKWRTTDFDLITGINWLVLTFLFTLLVSYTARILQKKFAYKKGYIATFRNTWQSLSITVGLSFFSFGLLPILSPGHVRLEPVERLRLGEDKQATHIKHMGWVSVAGIMSYVIWAVILKIIHNSAQGVIFNHMIFICLMLAVFSCLPIPSFDGISLFFYSRIWFVFFFGFILVFGALILFASLFSIILALLGGIIFTGLFVFGIDKPT